MNVMTTDQPVLNIKSEHEFLHDQAQAMRAAVYELLGNLLSAPPDNQVLERLANIGDGEPGDEPSDTRLAMGWQLMKQASLKANTTSLADEYFALFLGVGRGELVPFGSWYMTGFLMEKPVAVLRRDLTTLGIERQEGVVESEDHIAALCDAMALIIRNAQEIPLSTQQQFFNDHLAPWVSRFFNDMQNANSSHFYRSVGFFGESFFEFEQQLLDMQS